MDYKEVLKSVSQSAGRAWERVRYLSRANRILAISLVLVLSVGLIVWARAGFTLQIGRFFAAGNEITPSVSLSVRQLSNSGFLEQFNLLNLPIPSLPCVPGTSGLPLTPNCSGKIEYFLNWFTNLPRQFTDTTGIDIQCLPVAAPSDTKNTTFFADVAGVMVNGIVRPGGTRLGTWVGIEPKGGFVRVELGALQTLTSFRIECKASKADFNGGKLTSLTWYSNTICLPLPVGTQPAGGCVQSPGGTGIAPALPRGGTPGPTPVPGAGPVSTVAPGTGGTGGTGGAGASRPAPVAGTPATCTQLKGACRASAESGEVEVVGTGCSTGQKCFGKKTAPWSYCDYSTYTCKLGPETLVSGAATAVGPTDFNAPQCGAATCIPGTCRTWEGGDENSWKPSILPDGVPACEPLSVINSTTFPGFKGAEIVKPPITFPGIDGGLPNCFVIEDRSSHDPNFSTFTENTVPVVLAENPTAKLFMKAFVINNCPWPVHYVLQVDVDPKAKNDQGAGKRQCGDTATSGLVKTNMPDGFDFPSCWNNSLPATPANCSREISIEFDLKRYTCGSAGITTSIWHRVKGGVAGGANVVAERGGSLVNSSLLNWGKDCTGAVSEKRPACGTVSGAGGAGGTGGASCPVAAAGNSVTTPVVSVQCGATQNVVTWTSPQSVGGVIVKLQRNTYNSSGVAIAGGDLTNELGCTGTFKTNTFTDRTAPAGLNSYIVKVQTSPNVWSNSVTCQGGVAVVTSLPSPSQTPVATTSPVATATLSATPFPTVAPSPTVIPVSPVTPGPTITPPAQGNQLQVGPVSQTVTMNQPAFVQAFGGTGSYSLTTSTDGSLDQVAADRAAIRFATPGSRIVNVSDGQTTVTSTVVVSEPGIPENDDEDADTIADTIECPSFPCADTDVDIRADYVDADSDNDGIPDTTDPNRTIRNVAGSPATVPTGPGEATLLALVVSTLATLLYVSYTHSPLYRRREAEHVSQDQGPMDFRS